MTRQGSGIEASVGGIVGNAESEKINHVVWKSGSVTQEGGTFTADAVGVSSFVRKTDVQECADAQLKQTATYTDWKDEDGNAVVAIEGGKGMPWRIYDGKTTPLLTALMKGTKRLEKIYDGKTFGAGDAHIHMESTAEKNIGAYDAQGIYSDPFGYDLIGSTYKVIPRVLTLGTVAAQSKTYDGNTSADASKFHAALVGVVSGDENLVSVTATDAAYNSKDVRAANAVSYTLALSGTGAGNYRIASTVQGTGRITPKELTLDLTSGTRFDKTYDGNANVAQSLTKDGNYSLTGFVTGEGADIALDRVAGTYTAGKDAAVDKEVTFRNLALTGTGTGAANYVLKTTTLVGTGTIMPRTLTLTAAPQSIVQGEAMPSFTGRADGFAVGEDASVLGTDGIEFGTTVTSSDTPGSYDITGHIGGMSDGVVGNYRIQQAAGNANAFTIHAAALPGGFIAALVQDAVPRFDFGFGDSAYLFGTLRPIPTATLGLYRFSTARDLRIEGLRLD